MPSASSFVELANKLALTDEYFNYIYADITIILLKVNFLNFLNAF